MLGATDYQAHGGAGARMGINAYRPWRRDVSYTVAVYDPTFETPVKATFDLRK